MASPTPEELQAQITALQQQMNQIIGMADDDFVLPWSGEEIEKLLSGAGAASVRYDIAQSLTAAQKKQARDNIGADTVQGAVRYDTAQTLIASQQAQARSNINAAPGGYGYGEQIKCYNFTSERSAILEKFDTVLAGMGNDTTKQILLYDLSVSPGQVVCSARITKSDANNASVSSDFDENGQAIVYQKRGGTWQPVEYVNPNLILGVEYRTTERYQGKPVYCALVDFGALPNNTTKGLYVSGVSNIEATIRWAGLTSNGYALPGGNLYLGWDEIEVRIIKGRIDVKTTKDESAYSATFVLWFTKTTD